MTGWEAHPPRTAATGQSAGAVVQQPPGMQRDPGHIPGTFWPLAASNGQRRRVVGEPAGFFRGG